MEILEVKELHQVRGGLFGTKLGFILVTAGAFAVGLIDGFLRPLKCRRKWAKKN